MVAKKRGQAGRAAQASDARDNKRMCIEEETQTLTPVLLSLGTQSVELKLETLSVHTEKLLVESIINKDQEEQRKLLDAYRYLDLVGYSNFAFEIESDLYVTCQGISTSNPDIFGKEYDTSRDGNYRWRKSCPLLLRQGPLQQRQSTLRMCGDCRAEVKSCKLKLKRHNDLTPNQTRTQGEGMLSPKKGRKDSYLNQGEFKIRSGKKLQNLKVQVSKKTKYSF